MHKNTFFSLLSLAGLLFTVQTLTVSASMLTCPGKPDSTLNFSSSNCSTWSVDNGGNIACNIPIVANGVFSKTVANGNECTNVTLTCTAPLPQALSIDSLLWRPDLIWDGTDCVQPITGVISSSAATCSMPVNTGSCSVNLTWSTIPTPSAFISQVTRNNPVGTVFTADNGGPSAVTVSGSYANVAYTLINNGSNLDNVTITPSCASSLYWDTVSGTCKACSNGGCNPSTVPVNGGNPTGTLTCINGAIDPPTCTPATCNPPWGGTIANGASVTAYSTTNVAWNQSCAAGGTQETRTCNNGTLSGTFTNQTCTVDTPLPCNEAPWGAIAHGNSVTAYTSATVPNGDSCTSETRTCTNGVLSGNLTFQNCSVIGPVQGTLDIPAASCTVPLNSNSCTVSISSWTTTNPVGVSAVTQTNPATTTAGGNNGGPITAVVGYPSSNFYLYNNAVELATDSVTASCNASSYWNGSACVSDSCTPPWGGSIASGNSVTAYSTTYVASPATCSSGVISETRTCTNSVLSGSYTNGTCVEGSASFTSTPACNISIGSSGCNSTLGWTSANAGTVTLTDCGGGPYASYGTGAQSGSVYVPYNAGCYQIRDGSNNILTTVNPVTSSCTAGAAWNGSICVAVPTISLTATPASLLTGASSTLTWTVSGDAASCSIDGGVGAVSIAGGSVGVGPITTTTTYTLSCSNAAGTANDPATITVVASPELTASLITPATAIKGTSATFSSTITNNGDASTGASFNNFMQLADGPGGTGTVIDLAATSMADLASGGSDITAQSYTFTATGTYSMRACADKTTRVSVGVITESNEGNNCGLWQDIAVAWPAITGTVSANPNSCTIVDGANTCTTDFFWNTTNPIGLSQVIGDGGGPTSTAAISFTQTLAARFGNHIFRLYNNAQELASTTVAATCVATTSWDTANSKCALCLNGGCGPVPPNQCNNGANNPPSCSSGPNIMTGWLAAAPQSCIVSTGSSTCSTSVNPINLTWGITNPRPLPAYTAITLTPPAKGPEIPVADNNPPGGMDVAVPYRDNGAGESFPVKYFLYNNTVELGMQQINVSCAAGANKWDTVNNVCADPSVSAGIVGDYGYGSPNGISFSCLNSTTYEIRKDPAGANTLFDSGAYTGPTIIPLVSSATYSVICKHGSVSASQPVFYNSPPPPAVTISVNATPKTIDAGGKSTVSWDITFPPLAPLCTLTAKAVCANNVCTAAQTAAANALNTVIANGTTDTNDPSGSRPITDPTIGAISAPVVGNPNHKALGKKTFDVQGTTDFVVNCGNGNTATTRVRVASSNEQ